MGEAFLLTEKGLSITLNRIKTSFESEEKG